MGARLHKLGLAFLLLHVLAFVGIVTFRRYITAAHCKIEEIITLTNETGASPVPARFFQWMGSPHRLLKTAR